MSRSVVQPNERMRRVFAISPSFPFLWRIVCYSSAIHPIPTTRAAISRHRRPAGAGGSKGLPAPHNHQVTKMNITKSAGLGLLAFMLLTSTGALAGGVNIIMPSELSDYTEPKGGG